MARKVITFLWLCEPSAVCTVLGTEAPATQRQLEPTVKVHHLCCLVHRDWNWGANECIYYRAQCMWGMLCVLKMNQSNCIRDSLLTKLWIKYSRSFPFSCATLVYQFEPYYSCCFACTFYRSCSIWTSHLLASSMSNWGGPMHLRTVSSWCKRLSCFPLFKLSTAANRVSPWTRLTGPGLQKYL